MKVALSPRVPADLKVAVDDVLISRLKTVTSGARLTLARRASGRVAAALLLDVESRDGKIKAGKLIAGKINNAEASPDPSHADRARKPATHRSPRHQLRAASLRQRSPGACGRAACEVVPPRRSPRRPSANRASLASPRPGIQPRNPRRAAARSTRQFASPRQKSKTNSSAKARQVRLCRDGRLVRPSRAQLGGTSSQRTHGTQSAINTFVSRCAFPLRCEIQTSCFPSGLNIGNPSNPS